MKPSLPQLGDYFSKIDQIWNSKILSNFAYHSLEMERIISQYLKGRQVKLVSNADVGLIIALSVLNLGEGSEVIVPSFTFNSTANAVLWNKLIPVFSDINKDTFNIDPESIENKITKKTKAILATHVFGNPIELNSLKRLCKKYKLYLICDSAHAYGSKYQNKKIGTLADIDIFSFSGTKLVTSGEGGAVVCKNSVLCKKVNLARNYGFSGDYNSKILGINGKLSEMNAALGCLELPKIDKYVKRRNELAEMYKQHLKYVGDIKFQKIENGNLSSYKDFCILTQQRDRLATYLESNGVQSKKYFYPIHQMDLYKKYKTSLPNTNYISKLCLCLPIYNEMTNTEVLSVISIIKKFYNENN